MHVFQWAMMEKRDASYRFHYPRPHSGDEPLYGLGAKSRQSQSSAWFLPGEKSNAFFKPTLQRRQSFLQRFE